MPIIFVIVIVGCPIMKKPNIKANAGILADIILTYSPGWLVVMSLLYMYMPSPFTSPITRAIPMCLIGRYNLCSPITLKKSGNTVAIITHIVEATGFGLLDLFTKIGHAAKHKAVIIQYIMFYIYFCFVLFYFILYNIYILPYKSTIFPFFKLFVRGEMMSLWLDLEKIAFGDILNYI